MLVPEMLISSGVNIIRTTTRETKMECEDTYSQTRKRKFKPIMSNCQLVK